MLEDITHPTIRMNNSLSIRTGRSAIVMITNRRRHRLIERVIKLDVTVIIVHRPNNVRADDENRVVVHLLRQHLVLRHRPHPARLRHPRLVPLRSPARARPPPPDLTIRLISVAIVNQRMIHAIIIRKHRISMKINVRVWMSVSPRSFNSNNRRASRRRCLPKLTIVRYRYPMLLLQHSSLFPPHLRCPHP